MKGLDLTGKRFGRLLVLKDTGEKKKRQKVWLCQCDCGNTKKVITSYLTSGDIKSCGCYRKESELKNLSKIWGKPRTHGLSKTKLYRVYSDMKNRCNNTKCKAYKDYGQRGIKVCDEWQENFMNFYDWAIKSGYKDELSIDRIDNNKGYSPDNCRWATQREQANNTRLTKKVTILGETKTFYEFEKQYGIPAQLMHSRYNKGFRDEKVIYNGNLGSFKTTKLKRDAKGRFLKKEVANEI